MTNEQLFDDLKQYIDTSMSQQSAQIYDVEQRLNARIEGLDRRVDGIDQRIDSLDEKLDLIQDAIAETLTQANATTAATLHDHDQRLSRLERRTA